MANRAFETFAEEHDLSEEERQRVLHEVDQRDVDADGLDVGDYLQIAKEIGLLSIVRRLVRWIGRLF